MDQVTPILEVAALPGGPRVAPILDYVARNRNQGRSGTMLSIYARRLRASRDAKRLRAALVTERKPSPGSAHGKDRDSAAASQLTDEERSIVLQQAILLARRGGC